VNAMGVNLSELATALAASLATVLPAGFGVAAQSGRVRLEHVPSGSWISTDIAAVVSSAPTPDLGTESAAWSVLNAAQDFVTETLRRPWPSVDDSRGVSYLAPPRVEAAGHLLRLGFGEPDRWVLSCPPVHIR
jgi:hypothetical protein